MIKMTVTVQEALKRASLFLTKHQREEKIAEILLRHHLQFSKLDLLMHLQDVITDEQFALVMKDVERHALTGVPVQHLTGVETFFGRIFSVSDQVLIPRQETEELVQMVLEMVSKDPVGLRVVDVGTGSGVIAITLKKECPALQVEAADISTEALKIAKLNSQRLEADIRFVESDFLSAWLPEPHQVDAVVSNPPYIAYHEKAMLSDTVRDFDPELALFTDEEGTYSYRKIISEAKTVLKTKGLLAFEIGFSQGDKVAALIREVFPEAEITVRQDMFGRDRFVFARLGVTKR